MTNDELSSSHATRTTTNVTNNKAFFKLPKIVLTDCTEIAVRCEKRLKDTEQQFMYFGTAINAIKKDRLIYGGPAIADLLGSDIY